MPLLKTSLMTAIGVASRLLSLLAINKSLAVLVGPAGYAYFGSLQNLLTITTTISSAGLSSGVTRRISEASGQHTDLQVILGTAGRLSLYATCATSLILIFFASELSVFLFNSSNYIWVVWLIAGCQTLNVALTFLQAALIGEKNESSYFLVNITFSVLSAVAIVFLCWAFGIAGAFIGLAVSAAFGIGVAVLFLRQDTIRYSRLFLSSASYEEGRRLAGFSLMAIATSIIGPVALITVRSYVSSGISPEAAGYWEAAQRLSSIFMGFVSSLMAIYFFPRFSTKEKESENLVFKAALVAALVALTGSVTIFLFRDFAITMILSNEFAEVNSILGIQLIGDVFRTIAFAYSFFIMSQRLWKPFLVFDGLTAFIFVLIAYFLIPRMGLIGASWAYVISSVFYFIATTGYCRRLFRFRDEG